MAFASINQASVGGGSSNALSIQSDGIFMPRLSTGQRTALALTTSDSGLTVYDFTLNNLFIWNGTAWESIPGSGDAGANGSVQYNDNGIVSGATNFVWDKVNGRVGIGNNGPLSVLTVSSQVNARLSVRTTDAIFGSIAGGSGFDSLNDAGNTLVPFGCRGSTVTLGTGAGIGLTLNSTNNLVLAGGTAGANGVGVTFPAVQVPSSDANCLDDYEEGAWTPTSTTGTNLTAIVPLLAKYTKVGRVVTLSGYFSATVTVGSTLTYATLEGIPFAATLAQVGSAFEDVTLKVGFSQVNANDLNVFFAAGTALASGSKTFNYTITYQV
jgi:hypothetical protein